MKISNRTDNLFPDKYSRREFLQSVGGSFVYWSALSPMLASISLARGILPGIDGERPRVLADLHVHPTLNKWIESSAIGVNAPLLAKLARNMLNPTTVDWKLCHETGIDLMCAAHFNPFDEFAGMETDPTADAPRNTLRMLDQLEYELRTDAGSYAKLVRSGAELKEVLRYRPGHRDYRIAVLHCLEGGHALGGNLDSLNTFAKRHVAMITVTHFFTKGIASSANSIPFFPDAFTNPPKQGLSEFGKNVITQMEELGIIVDVAHGTSTTINDILKIARKPLIASHVSARTLGDHPYSLDDEHIQEIARKGGIIGVILMPYWLSNYANFHLSVEQGTLRDVVRTIRYIYKICGTHTCIGIGSDFSGYIHGPAEMTDLSQIGVLKSMLLEEFDDDVDLVEDIMANNVINFFGKNWQPGESFSK